IIYGRSLGSAVATHTAADNEPGQLILESPFHSLADVAQVRFPLFPVKGLLKYELPNNVNLNAVNCPVTIYHGTEDYVVPFKSGQRLYLESRNGKTDLVPIEDGGHNDLVTFEAYRKHIQQLLK
ncbi:MAG: alpha/beta hydrolase, partial [Bacteroidia bacterium]|nr:alpha/beta hydrolase [Bacteroidia bacterium]